MTIDKDLALLNDLKKRFSYMFNGPNLGIDIFRGWLLDFVEACEKIDALLGVDKRGFHFTQCKEKYGWARYYFSTSGGRINKISARFKDGIREITSGLEGHEIEHQITKILGDAEEKSMKKCIVCGAPAEIRTYGRFECCACEKHSPDVLGDHLKTAALK